MRETLMPRPANTKTNTTDVGLWRCVNCVERKKRCFGLRTDSSYYLRYNNNHSRRMKRFGQIGPVGWILFAVCFIIGAAGVITVCILHSQISREAYSYAIGMDAGSSHTDLYVYKWPTDKLNGTGIVEQIYSCPAKSDPKMPPLSSFVNNPSNAGSQAVKPCLDKALTIIPKSSYSATPVYLGATAGMRVLRLANSGSAEAIIQNVQDFISTYPFLFTQPQQQASIIDGSLEGAYGWINANYLSGSFRVPSSDRRPPSVMTVGALDMGGASTQMTFYPANPAAVIPGFSESLQLFGYEYNVYTHSYTCYGMDEGNRQYKAWLVQSQNFSIDIDDPCAPLGNTTKWEFTNVFSAPCTPASPSIPDGVPASIVNQTFLFHGQSDPERCQELTRNIFNFSALCPYTNNCTFDGVYQPPLFGNFLAFSGFFFVVSDLGLMDQKSNFSLNDYRNAMNTYCDKSWSEVSNSTKPGSILVVLCFQAQFNYHVLIDAYEFNEENWKSISFVSQVNGTDFGWNLGMVINATNVLPSNAYSAPISDALFIALVTVFSVLLLLSHLVLFAACIYSARTSSSAKMMV